MISTKPKEDKVDKTEEVFQQYIKLEGEDRSEFMAKVTRWLTQRVEEDNRKRRESEESKEK